MIDDYVIKAEFQENYRYAHDFWAPFIKDAQVYSLAASGYTWSDDERKALIKEGREPLEYNIMRRPLQFFSGYLRDNINQIIYSPVEGSDQQTADQFTKLGYYVWDKGQGYPTFLDAADESFKSGISLCGLQMDYSRDFIHGDISFYKRTYNSFFLDPTFENINLSDCGFTITRDLIGKSSVKSLCPFIDPKTIDELPMGFRDDKFLQYHPQFTTFSRNRNLVAYDQYYKRTTRMRKFLVDNSSGHTQDISDMSKEDMNKLKLGLRRLSEMRVDADILGINPEEIPNVEIMNVERPYVELHILMNGVPLYVGEDKTGIVHTYPFAPILAYMEPSIWMPSQRIQGIASTMWSCQRNFNKRHMKIIDMMDSDISTGFKYLLGSVPDVSDMQQSGQNKLIGIDPENAPQGLDSVQQLSGGGANPALIQYQQVLDQLSLTLSNVNESVLGVDDKGNTQISGRLAEVRIGQGLRSNRKVFDNVETAQQILGGLIMNVIQNKYPPEKVMRILAQEPTQQFYEKQFEQYDAVIKEGVRSKSQRDAYYYELVNLKRDGIVDVPQEEIVKSLSMAGLSDLEAAMKARDEAQAQEKALAQEVQKKQIENLDASTQEKLGLAKERNARVLSNLALKDERESEAQQNIAQAALDRAKAITEIAKMRTDQLLQVLSFVNTLEQQEAIGREAQKGQVSAQANQINADIEGTAEAEQKQMLQQVQQGQNQMMNEFNEGG